MTGSEYTVRDGDTLQIIARQHYGSVSAWPRIWRANRQTIEAELNRRMKHLPEDVQRRIEREKAVRETYAADWIFPGTVLKIPQEPHDQ